MNADRSAPGTAAAAPRRVVGAPPGRAAPRESPLPAPALSLQIDRLVLDGFPLDIGGRAQFQVTLEAELARLLRERPLRASLGGTVPSLNLGELRLPAGADAQGLGLALARALHRGMAP